MSSRLSPERWILLFYLSFMPCMTHRFSKFRILQLTCPFTDKNFCQSKNESRKKGRSPNLLNWKWASKMTFTGIANDKSFTGQGRMHFLKHALNYTYLLSNFFFHLYWGPQLCNLFDTFTSISSILPKDVVLRVRTTNDCRPVVGASFQREEKKDQPSRQLQSKIPNFLLKWKVWSSQSSPVLSFCIWCMLSVLTISIHHIFRAMRTSQWTTEI